MGIKLDLTGKARREIRLNLIVASIFATQASEEERTLLFQVLPRMKEGRVILNDNCLTGKRRGRSFNFFLPFKPYFPSAAYYVHI